MYGIYPVKISCSVHKFFERNVMKREQNYHIHIYRNRLIQKLNDETMFLLIFRTNLRIDISHSQFIIVVVVYLYT